MSTARMTLLINGIDYSSWFSKLTYTVKYERREGLNSGMMKDGSKVIDLLANKAVITLTTNTMDNAALSDLLVNLNASTVTIKFSDPLSNAGRTSTFIPEVGEAKIAFYRDSTLYWRNGTTITLTEV